MNSPLKNLVPWSDQNGLSGWNSHCVWVRTLSFFLLRVRSQGFDEAKYQGGGWIYYICCSIVQHKYYLSLPLQQGRFQSRATNTWQEIFPRGVRGEPLTSLPLIRKPASGTRASNGGRKISTKTVRKKRLLVIVLSWNLAWWLRTTNYVRKCKNMEYQNSGPSGTLRRNQDMEGDFEWLNKKSEKIGRQSHERLRILQLRHNWGNIQLNWLYSGY